MTRDRTTIALRDETHERFVEMKPEGSGSHAEWIETLLDTYEQHHELEELHERFDQLEAKLDDCGCNNGD